MPELDPQFVTLAKMIAGNVTDNLHADPPPEPASPWLSTEQAARYLGVSVKTMQNWRLDGTGPEYVQRGNKIRRYHVRKLDAWLEAGGASG